MIPDDIYPCRFGIYLLNYLWVKNQEELERTPTKTEGVTENTALLLLLLEVLKEDNSQSVFLGGVVIPFKMLKGLLSCWWLAMHPVEHWAL